MCRHTIMSHVVPAKAIFAACGGDQFSCKSFIIQGKSLPLMEALEWGCCLLVAQIIGEPAVSTKAAVNMDDSASVGHELWCMCGIFNG